MSNMKPCKICNKEVAKSAKTCPHCGAKLRMGFFKKAFLGIVGFIVIVIIIAVASNSEGDKATSGAPATGSKSTAAPAKTFKIGDDVASGNITYKINGVKTASKLGKSDAFSKKTEGQFIIIDISVLNNDKDSRTIDTNLFKLKDAAGKEYSADAMADMYANEGGTTFFLAKVNPGLTKTGFIVFETPKDIKGLILECSSGLGFSGGKYVSIDLGI